MSALSLAFPAWVRSEGSRWTASPLLAPAHQASGHDPAKAVDALERHLARALQGEGHLDTDDLLRLSFLPPDLVTTRQNLRFGHGKRMVVHAVITATFTVGAHRYVRIPCLDRWLLLDGALSGVDLHEALQGQIDAWVRAGGEPPPTLVRQLRERILPAGITVDLQPAPLSLDGSGSTPPIRASAPGRSSARSSDASSRASPSSWRRAVPRCRSGSAPRGRASTSRSTSTSCGGPTR